MSVAVAGETLLTVRRLAALLLAVVSAAMLGLAAGALWMLPTMALRHPLPWLAVPAGWLLATAVRGWVYPAGMPAALLATAASVLAAAYVSMLTGAARIAGAMGISLTDALREAGPGMLLQLAKLTLSSSELGWFAAGALVAAWVAARPSRGR